MTRDDAVRAVAALLGEVDARVREFVERHPEGTKEGEEAYRAYLLVHFAGSYGLALTRDNGEDLPL